MTERAQTACCHASEVVYQSEAPEQSEDRGVVRGDGGQTGRDDGKSGLPARGVVGQALARTFT